MPSFTTALPSSDVIHEQSRIRQHADSSSEPRHDKTNKMSVHPASAHSDQSLRCQHEESLGP